MNQEPAEQTKKNDEIDLLDLFTRMGKSIAHGFRSVGRASLFVVFFMLRKWFWLFLSILLGTGLSFLIKYSTQRFYSSEITLRSNTVGNADMIQYINKLHTFCKEENMIELAAALSVDTGKVRHIKDIRAFWVIDMGRDYVPDYVDYRDHHNVLDTVNVRMTDRFVVQVKTSIPQELIAIRDGILAFAEKNDFYIQQNNLRLQQNEVIRSRFEYEIEQLDSLQKVKYFEESRKLIPPEGGQMIFLQEQRTQLLHEDIYDLLRRKQEIEAQLTIYSGLVTLLSDFTPPVKPENGALYYGKVVIPVIFLLAIILLLLYDNRHTLKETAQKY